MVLTCALGAAAAPFTFTGGGTTASWTNAANWSGGAPPPDDGSADVTLLGGSALNLDGSRAVRTLSFAGAGTFAIAPGSDPGSILLVAGGSVSFSTRGKLVVQVPLFAPGAFSVAGFEPQTSLRNRGYRSE